MRMDLTPEWMKGLDEYHRNEVSEWLSTYVNPVFCAQVEVLSTDLSTAKVSFKADMYDLNGQGQPYLDAQYEPKMADSVVFSSSDFPEIVGYRIRETSPGA